MLAEYDVVKCVAAMQSVPKGTQGTILQVSHDSNEPYYLVEFVDGSGVTIEIVSAREDQLKLVKAFNEM